MDERNLGKRADMVFIAFGGATIIAIVSAIVTFYLSMAYISRHPRSQDAMAGLGAIFNGIMVGLLVWIATFVMLVRYLWRRLPRTSAQV